MYIGKLREYLVLYLYLAITFTQATNADNEDIQTRTRACTLLQSRAVRGTWCIATGEVWYYLRISGSATSIEIKSTKFWWKFNGILITRPYFTDRGCHKQKTGGEIARWTICVYIVCA